MMGFKKMLTGVLVMLAMYIFLLQEPQHVLGASSATNADGTHRPRSRHIRLIPRIGNQYAKIKPEFSDFIVDDDDFYELSKRQTSDDYGHWRFGKRGEEQFDDYGHLRFGRGGD